MPTQENWGVQLVGLDGLTRGFVEGLSVGFVSGAAKGLCGEKSGLVVLEGYEPPKGDCEYGVYALAGGGV